MGDRTPILKLKQNPRSETLTSTIKEYTIAGQHSPDGIQVPAAPVLPLNAVGDRVIPCVDWPSIPPKAAATAVPAAGASAAAVTVPAGKIWQLQSVMATVTTDANVADRTALIRITDGATIVMNIAVAFYMGINTAYTCTWVRDGPDNGVAKPIVTTRLGDLQLPAGWTFQLILNAIQAGDQFTAAQYTYKEATE